MSDETNNPQPTDPPTNSGGTGGTASDAEEIQLAEAQATDPPTNTGGGGTNT